MAGKKRKLKKELKRKLKKDIKKDIKKKENKDTKAAESKVEKQVIDNQTLQQIMMAQMMNSRSRVRNGENTSWLATQNQRYADEIKHRQELNAMNEQNKELRRQRDNIEENEKYKKLKEEKENEEKMLKRKIIELNEAKEQVEKLKILNDEIEKLKKELAEKNKELNNPVRLKEIEAEGLNAQIEYINKQIKDGKKDKKELAIYEQKLKTLKEHQETAEKLKNVIDEKTQIESRLSVLLKPLRDIFPELKRLRINNKQLYDNAIEITNEITNKIDYYNQQIESINENKKMIQTLKQTKETYDMYVENMRKEHPLFDLIYTEKLSEYGENITPEDKEKVLNEALNEYKMKMRDYINENDNEDVKPDELPVDNNEDDNPDNKVYELPVDNNEYMSSSSDNEDDNTSWKSIDTNVGDKLLSDSNYINVDDHKQDVSVNESVNENDNSKDDELAVAQFGPGRE